MTQWQECSILQSDPTEVPGCRYVLTEGHLEWPTWWLMLLMPAGGVLLALVAVEALWRALAGLPPRHGDGAHGAGEVGDRG